MWRYAFLFLFCILASKSYSQNKSLADSYFRQGDYIKALDIYQELYQQTPNNYNVFIDLVKTHQELEAYDQAQALLEEKAKNLKNPQLLIELAQNAVLQHKQTEAELYFQQTLAKVKELPMYAGVAGQTLEKYNLLEWAEEIYKTALEQDAYNPNIHILLGNLYGVQSKIEEMFLAFIDLVENDERYNEIARHHFSKFIEEDAAAESNRIFKRILMQKIQKYQSLLYYDLLSWVFIQEKDYQKAFVQEKAIRLRDPDVGLRRVKDLAFFSYLEQDYEITSEIVKYILKQADPEDIQTIFDAEHLLLQIQVDTAKETEYQHVLEHFKNLLEKYKAEPKVALTIEMDYAKFIAYKLDQKEEAVERLKKLLDLEPTRFTQAQIRMLLGDILVTQSQFNLALIQYTHVQRSMEGHALGNEANFKIAQTSYFKGDFKWALTQLDVLKRSATQLIANDAMFLNLRIQDNILTDSTHTSLKDFALADLMIIQGNTQQAIKQLEGILITHEGKSIIDDTHFKLGELYYDKAEYDKAAEHWQIVASEYAYDLLADAALYKLGLLYEEKLNQPEKAMGYFERVIFDHSDSIYYVDARKRFRKLRGDFKPKT